MIHWQKLDKNGNTTKWINSWIMHFYPVAKMQIEKCTFIKNILFVSYEKIMAQEKTEGGYKMKI